MTNLEHLASLAHARAFLRKLRRLDTAEPGDEVTESGLEMFDRIWGQVLHAHVWLAEHPGIDTDHLCAAYPMTALPYWMVRVPAHEQEVRLSAACAAASRQDDPGTLGALAHHLGAACLKLGSPGNAAAHFNQALAVSLAHGNAHAEAQDREGLARACLELGLPKWALQHLRSALAIFRDVGDRRGQALGLRTLGRCQRKLNQLEEGHRSAREAARIFAELGSSLDSLGTVNESLLDLGTTVSEYLENLKSRIARWDSSLNQDDRIDSLEQLARIHLWLDEPQEAMRLLDQALDAARVTNAFNKELALLGALAEATHALGNAEEALAAAEERARLAKQAGDSLQRWTALHALGDLYRESGRPDRALAAHGDALRTVFEDTPDLESQTSRRPTGPRPGEDAEGIFEVMVGFTAYKSTLAALGRDHADLGDLQQAIAHWEHATVGADDSAEAVVVLGLLAMAYANTGQHAAAIEYHERQLKIIRQRADRAAEADVLGEMANVHQLLLHEAAEAIDLYQSAYVIDLQIGADRDMTAVLTQLAQAEQLAGRPQRARDYGDRALALAHGIGDARVIRIVETALVDITNLRAPQRPSGGQPEPLRRAAGLLAAGQQHTAETVLAAALESEDPHVAAGAGLLLGRITTDKNLEIARAAWNRAAQCGDPAHSPQAALALAHLCERHGGTAEEWATVAQTDGCAVSAAAAARLGELLLADKQYTQARAALEKAIVLGSAPAATATVRTSTAVSLFNLGTVLTALDDRLGAREAFRAAGHPSSPVRAAANLELGQLIEHSDPAGALAAYEQAAATGDARVSAQAHARLGRLALKRRDLDAAEEALQTAIASEHRLAALDASAALGIVRLHRNDTAGARAAWEAACTSPTRVVMAEASANLGALLAAQGQPAEAEELWDSIPLTGDELIDRMVAFYRAGTMLQRGDHDGVREAWHRSFGDQAAHQALGLSRQLELSQARLVLEQVLVLGDPDILPAALSALLALLDERERVSRLRQAVDEGEPQLAPLAALRLGVLLAKDGDIEAARDLWHVVVTSQHPDHGPYAMYEIALSYRRANELRTARDWYRRAMATGSAITPYAAVNLGGVLVELDDPQGAEAVWQVAIESDNREQAGMAWANLGSLRRHRGDLEGARRAGLRALGATPEAHYQATQLLHALREERGSIETAEPSTGAGGATPA
ncbi:tetratricopeptide repeat protein [Streptomyces sp. BA2]|uniref:tetratricopeptide repeat protein n=1 Tax=Streptomyces sp. BA2 TaxID=436595 RepID=UPI001324547D|nr:tetratricopeptide repeat protein [Streptomyces sp. BA2]MWA16270.1 tetratricopeptide repeat protein [Streptomyces sp. BA2]